MVDLQTGTFHDIEIMFQHLIVYRIHGTGGTVLNGKDPVLAHPGLYRPEDVRERFKKHDGRSLEHPVTGDLGIGPFRSLAGHDCLRWEQVRRIRQGLMNGIHQRVACLHRVPSGTVCRGNGMKYRLRTVLGLRPGQFRHLGDKFPLSAGIRGQDPVFPLYFLLCL